MTTRTYSTRGGFVRFIDAKFVMCSIIVIGLFLSAANAGAFDIRLGTAEKGSFSFYTGRMISKVITAQAAGIKCTTVPGTGDVHNLTNLREGSLDLAIVDTRMLFDAANKKGAFEFLDIKYDNLRTLMALYDTPVTIVSRTDAGISSMADLKGKRLNAGVTFSPPHRAVQTIMAVNSWTEKDFSLLENLPRSQSQDTMAFCHGTVQAMVHIGVHPNAILQQLFKICGAQIVGLNSADIKKFSDYHQAIVPVEIPAGTYQGQAESMTTFGTSTVLAATADLDEETVHAVMKAISLEKRRLESKHPAIFTSYLEEPVPGRSKTDIVGVPLHPGAVGFLSEE